MKEVILIRNYGSDVSVRKIAVPQPGVLGGSERIEYRVYRGEFPVHSFADAEEADDAANRLVRTLAVT